MGSELSQPPVAADLERDAALARSEAFYRAVGSGVGSRSRSGLRRSLWASVELWRGAERVGERPRTEQAGIDRRSS
jgi:hypothetical protein